MIKTIKNIKKFFCFLVAFLLVTFSFACKDDKNPITLETPKVTISENGVASWQKIENATSYKFVINNGEEQETFELEVQLANGDTIIVKATSADSKYKDSEFSAPSKYEKQVAEKKLDTPIVEIDKNGLAKWQKIENADAYKISINGSTDYVVNTTLEYQISDLETISVSAISEKDEFIDSDFSLVKMWIKTSGDGTSDNPYTVNDAKKLIENKYNDGKVSSEEFYFKGIVSGTPTLSNNNYKFDLIDENNNKIVAFNIDKNNIEFGANSEVLILSKVQYYDNKTPELVYGKIIHSDNKPVEIEEKTIKELLEIGVSDTQYKVTGIVSNITNTLYGNFDLVDGDSKIYIYGLLNEKLESKMFASLNVFEGDVLTIIGNVAEYNGNLQIKNAIFVKVENKDAKITVNPVENGTIGEIPSSVKKGTTIKFNVTPNEGFVIGKVYANDKELEGNQGVYEFVANGDVTITVEIVREGIILDTTKKYVFADYPAGEQYALKEEHKLDDDVFVLTNDAHFTKELRLYSSSSHNGYAIFSLLNPEKAYKGISFSAGYKETVLSIYGSNDGEKYEVIADVFVETKYKDYTVNFKNKLYKYIKLDPKLDLQVRVQNITLTFGADKIHEHEFSENWSHDAENHYHECYCGEKKDTSAHNFEWIIDKEPTDDENGVKHEECTVCKFKRNEGTVIQKLSHVHEWVEATCEEVRKCKTCGEIDGEPLGHDYDIVNISWNWSTFSYAIATVKCKRDSSHTFMINGTISSQVIKKATCAEEGMLIYMARITLNGVEYGDVKTANISKTTNHVYEDGECIICHKVLTNSIFTKVTDESQLVEGDTIIIVSEAKNATAVALGKNAYFNSKEYGASFDDASPIEIVLGKKNGDWTLTTSEGIIGTKEVKKLNYDGEGTITWKITFDADGDAIIASTDTNCGRILYNVRSPRFLNYTSSVNENMLLPQIYKFVKAKCNHVFGTLNAEVPATCVKEGTKAHYHCSVCDKNYDVNGKLLKDLTIAKIPHNYVDGRCSVCDKIDSTQHQLDFENIVWNWTGYTKAIAEISCKDNDGVKELVTATITSEIVKAATCKEKGIKSYLATIEYDGNTYTNTVTEEINTANHTYINNICSLCNHEITESEILDALFALGKNKSLEGTYQLTGIITKINTAYSTQYKNITVTIKVADKEVMCFRLAGDGAEGLAVCDKITVSGKLKNYNGTKEFDAGCAVSNIIKAAHALGDFIDEIPATCTSEGTKGHYHCEICDKDFDASKNLLTSLVIEKLDHNFGTLISEVPATCTSEGVKEHYHCEACGKDFDASKNELTTTVISKLAHDYSADWSCDETKHYHKCNNCDDVTDASEHNMVWVVDKAATILETGLKHEECITCGFTRNMGTVIEKVDHEHDWKEATCTEPKTCKLCDAVEGEALGHDYAEPEWTWTGFESATAKFVCNRDNTHCEIVSATITLENSTDAKCNADGIKTYKATVTFNGRTYSSLNLETIPMTNKHTYVNNVCSSCNHEITESEILDALFALDKNESLEGTYQLTGMITKINTAYSTQYKNITVTIKVADKEVMCFRLAGDGAEGLAVCDKITVSGKLKNYNGTKEFDAGCAVSNIEKDLHQYGDLMSEVAATCTSEGVKEHYHCEVCGKDFDASKNELTTTVINKIDHNFVSGTCTACGEKEQSTPALKYTKVTDASTLKAGDKIIFVCESKAKYIGAFGSGKFFTAVDSEDNAIVITLGGKEGEWTFTTSEGLIGTSAAKALNCKGNGTTTWTITIDENGDATIASTDSYGKILYNVGSPRFLNYTSDPTASMLLPQIFKLSGTETSCEHDFGTLIPEITATCKDEGTKAHYECSKCHKYFDIDKKELTSLVIDKTTDHDFGTLIPEVAATCTSEGVKEHYHCEVCGKDFDASKNELTTTVINKIDHNFVSGTCTACGEKETASKKELSADFTTKSAKSNSYTGEWKYGDFTIKGGANNNGGWNYIKFGGKNTNLANCNPVYAETTNSVDFAVSKILVNIIAGSLKNGSMKVNSWGVEVLDSEGNIVDTVLGEEITKDAKEYTFVASEGVTWASGYKYRVFFDLTNTSTTNGIIWLDKITLSE